MRSATLRGVEAVPVDVEVVMANGIPGFSIVGLADASVVFQAVHPKSETGKVGGDGRHPESHALQRGISPRFIIGRIDTEVLA